MYNILLSRLTDEKGIVLFPAAVLLFLVFTIAVTAWELSVTETQISLNQLHGTEALYLAEAGIQMAIHQLERDPSWTTGFHNRSLGKGLLKEVQIEHFGNSVRIESQGEVEGVARRLRVELNKIHVPFIYPLVTHRLELRPGARVHIDKEAIHLGDLSLLSRAELNADLTVNGSVALDEVVVKGFLAATGPITIHEEATVEAVLVSADEIIYYGPAPSHTYFPQTPVSVPGISATKDFNWYYRQPHLLLEEPVLSTEDIFSGIYIAPGDLTVMPGEADPFYLGQSAVVVPGTARITGNLLPQDPLNDSLFVIANNIIVEGAVEQLEAALFASESIQVYGSYATKKLTGTLQAPLVSFPPGTTEVTYRPLKGTHLVEDAQILFQITNWMEILIR